MGRGSSYDPAVADGDRQCDAALPRIDQPDLALRAGLRRHRTAREIVLAWRRLVRRSTQADEATGAVNAAEADRRAATLVACSGGADSVCLAASLGAAGGRGPVTLAYVHHVGMRTAVETERDASLVRSLGGRLGVAVVEAEAHAPAIETGSGGRTAGRPSEASLRRARYSALATLARNLRAGFVVTGHHADDQLETVLMALMRGAGARGLAGIAAVRTLHESEPKASRTKPLAAAHETRRAQTDARGDRPPIRLLRPMLQIERAAARAMCESLGLDWREDPTNEDTTLLRNALRARVTPVLEELRPGVANRVARSSSAVRAAADLLERSGRELLERARMDAEAVGPPGVESSPVIALWSRSRLNEGEPAALAAGVRWLAREVLATTEHTSANSWSARGVAQNAQLDEFVRIVRDASPEPRSVELGGGLRCVVRHDRVYLAIRIDPNRDGRDA